MSTTGTEPAPTPRPPTGGVHAALRFTGIPVSWLSKRPKLPSRNWLIFIGVTSSLVGLYAYDRKKCRDIRESYVKRVEHLAQEPMGSKELPRKVKVFSCKWPGDEDFKRGQRYFRKYIKPILVSAAIDYEEETGHRHGDLARKISDKIKEQRRIELGLEAPKESLVPTLITLTKEEKEERNLAGGSVIIGRAAFKEYLEGIRRGWMEPPVRVDREEALAHVLEDDGHFDEPEPAESMDDVEGEPLPTKSRLMPSKELQSLSPISSVMQPKPPTSSVAQPDTESYTPPSSIPAQPPLLLVPFTNYVGFKLIPLMIYDFFYQRAKVAAGAEAAYRLVMAHTRPFSAPLLDAPPPPLFSPDERRPKTDIDFDRQSETYYPGSTSSNLRNIEKQREEYYKALPAKLETARALARGTREATKEEQSYPPPTEVELRAERLKKEMRWRNDEEGWRIVRPEADVAWDERFRDVLSVFIDAP